MRMPTRAHVAVDVSRKLKWRGFRLLPSSLVPQRFKDDGLYIPGGFSCWCGWTTEKTALSGRQALRGHLKGHAYERRAWQRPLKHQAALLAVMASIASYIEIYGVDVAAVQTVMVPDTALWVATGVAGLSAAIGLLAGFGPIDRSTRERLTWVRLGWVAATLGGLWLVAAAALHSSPGLWSYPAAAALGAATLWLAPTQGAMTYAIRRRKIRPTAYVSLHRARDEDAEIELEFEHWRPERERRAKERKAGRGIQQSRKSRGHNRRR